MGAAGQSAGQPFKLLVLSPLLNLADTAPGAPTIVQHVDLLAAGTGALVAVATLSLPPGRGSLRIAVSDWDGFRSRGVRLCCLGALAEAGRNPSDQAIRAVEVIRGPAGAETGGFVAELSLHGRSVLPSLSPNDHPALAAAAIEGLRADAILGVAVAPRDVALHVRRADLGGAGDDPQSLRYLERRLGEALSAAADAKLPVATARHVELATLFAREIQARRKGIPAAAAARDAVFGNP